MILQNLGQRVDSTTAKIVQSYGGFFPFQGKYLLAFRAFLLANTERLRGEWERFHTSGDVHKLIDFVIDLARGNLPVPWYLAPFAGAFLEALRVWLHANSNVFRDGIGATN